MPDTLSRLVKNSILISNQTHFFSFLGDPHQACGGESDPDPHATFFVATCPQGQLRFGDACLEVIEEMDNIKENQDKCMNKVKITTR